MVTLCGSNVTEGDASNINNNITGNENEVNYEYDSDQISLTTGNNIILGDAEQLDINLSATSEENTISIKHGNDVINGGDSNDNIHGDTTDIYRSPFKMRNFRHR